MLNRLTPFFAINSPFHDVNETDPLIYVDLRQIRRPTLNETLRRDAFRLGFMLVLVVFFSLWLSRPDEFWSAYALFLGLFTFCLWLAGFVMDLILIANGVYTFRHFTNSDIYELVSVSTLPARSVIESRFVAAQLRSWAIIRSVTILRVGFLLLWLPYIIYAINEYILDPSRLPIIRAALLGGLLTVLPVASYYFVYELLWRYQYLIAISLRITTGNPELSRNIGWLMVRYLLHIYAQVMLFILPHGLFSAIPLGILTVSVNATTPYPYDVILTFLAVFVYGFALLATFLYMRSVQIPASTGELTAAAAHLDKTSAA